MELSASHYLGVPLVAMWGEVDHSSSQTLWEMCDRALAEGDTLALDLKGCPYMDSGGISVLLSLLLRVRPRGALAVIAPDPDLLRIFEIVGLTQDASFFVLASADELANLGN
jgi:anti-anti-sigma factor